jgi:hypothetical protein
VYLDKLVRILTSPIVSLDLAILSRVLQIPSNHHRRGSLKTPNWMRSSRLDLKRLEGEGAETYRYLSGKLIHES